MNDDDEPIILPSRVEVTRRDALQLFGAGVLALQTACLEQPGSQEIRPPVKKPQVPPGTPRLFATSMVIDGFATGLIARSNDGRPTKLEGNPLHPASLGATSAQHQASILDLYDPHRLRVPQVHGQPATWTKFRTALERLPEGELWLVVPPDASPTISALLDTIRERHRAQIVQYAAIDRTNAYRATQLAFGVPLEQQLALDQADVVVALDADILAGMPMSLRWAHDFATRRRAVEPGQRPVQLFVAEPMLTPTGSMADHRLAIRAGDMTAIAIALADELSRRGMAIAGAPPAVPRDAARARISNVTAQWIVRVVDALVRSRGAAVLVAGDRLPAAAQALVHRITLALGSRASSYTESVIAREGPSLADLARALRDRRVGAVLALDTDPVYSAPPQLDLGKLISEAPLSVHATMHATETSAVCGWVVPLSHYLESWGDGRAWDGTASPIQPLIQPLHHTQSRLAILAMLAGELSDDRTLVRAQWRKTIENDTDWKRTLANGVIEGTTSQARPVAATGDAFLSELALAPDEPIEIDLAPSPTIDDGRFATNPWLQELPHPLTKLTWTNAAYVSRAMAKQLGVENGDMLRVQANGRAIDVPTMIAHGHAERCVTIELGYGHHNTNPISNEIGANAYKLTGNGPIVHGGSVKRTGKHMRLSRTQEFFSDLDREIVFASTLAKYRANPNFTANARDPLPTMLDPAKRVEDVPQWMMTIDTTICTGCSSCVIACQAENNIPVVGPSGVRRGREMQWLRIDTYVHEDSVVHQPMLCQHCDHAPCEYVCPVNATVHSPDGLNEMVYNRCVGTRFCSNNCPYKVRRFNFFDYLKHDTTALQKNPDVTVRARGVMEKCTFCVQRIRGAEHQALMEKRPIQTGEVVTACQQACPTGAIQFAARQHSDSAAVQWAKVPRAYHVLHDLGTRPRITYLAKIFDTGEAE